MTEEPNILSEKQSAQGIPIVLTGDRVLMADYQVLLDGMFAAAQTTSTPDFLMRSFVSPPMPCDGVRVTKAPLGLRRIEARLIRSGRSGEDVAIVPPERLADAIGPATRAVLVSSGDPLGLGMNDSTMSAIAGGRPYAQVWLEAMLRDLRRRKSGYPGLKIILGGPGAWQVAQDEKAREDLGIDVVFCGYAERDLTHVVDAVISGRKVEPVHTASRVGADDIPAILGPTSMGVVETSRGCGLGCRFCTLRTEPMIHMPIEAIVRDVETNVRGGVRSVSLVSENLLRYGSEDGRPNPARLIEMLHAVRGVKGLRLIQTDHVNVASVAQFPETDLREVHNVMTRGVQHEYLWVNIGVESASGELLDANACAAKVRPFRIHEWGDVCERAVRRLIAAGFIPMVSLVFGLPGEKEAHVRGTLALVERLAGERAMIFPLFFAPLSAEQKAFGLDDMTPLHWRLFRLCYRLNFKWLPKTYWDNQRGAGVSLASRMLMQAAGQANALGWKLRFIWKSGRFSA